jgi:hypothetical protein
MPPPLTDAWPQTSIRHRRPLAGRLRLLLASDAAAEIVCFFFSII